MVIRSDVSYYAQARQVEHEVESTCLRPCGAARPLLKSCGETRLGMYDNLGTLHTMVS